MPDQDPARLKQTWLSYVREWLATARPMRPTPKRSVRFATFNVHYFTDTHEKNTYRQILDTIEAIDADFILLNEVILGGKVKVNATTTVDVSNWYADIAKRGYQRCIFCNVVPAWFNAVFGNALLVHQRVRCDDFICNAINETIHTFPKSEHVVAVSGQHAGVRETRCMIRASFPWRDVHVAIYGVHLDVASEDTRLAQIKEVVRQVRRDGKAHGDSYAPFIMGDFNTFDATQYPRDDPRMRTTFARGNGKVVGYLKKQGFYDCATVNGGEAPEMSTWSNVRVDFIFGAHPDLRRRIRFDTVPTLASDHLPVVITLRPPRSARRRTA